MKRIDVIVHPIDVKYCPIEKNDCYNCQYKHCFGTYYNKHPFIDCGYDDYMFYISQSY